MKKHLLPLIGVAALSFGSAHATVITYQNGTSGYTGNQGRMTTSFGGGTTTTDQYGGSLGGQGRFVTPIRFNSLSSGTGWIDPNSVGFGVNSITLTLTVESNTLNGDGTLALVFNNRGSNSNWVEGQVNQAVISTGTSWAGPGGTLTSAGSGVAPFAGSGAWDIGAANNGMPIMATATVSNTTTVNSTVAFTFTGLSEAEEIELLQIWSHDYGSGSLLVGGQTYTANPGMFLSFSAAGTYTTGDIRFYGDNTGTVSNRPVLSLDVVPEPATGVLLLGGMSVLMAVRRRRSS
jgi:hypothetical protein